MKRKIKSYTIIFFLVLILLNYKAILKIFELVIDFPIPAIIFIIIVIVFLRDKDLSRSVDEGLVP